jgi:probable rRNA maturation factor
MRLDLHVQYASACVDLPPKPAIAAWTRAALQNVDAPRVEVGVRIVDEPESAALNERYRGKSGATNVLSFPYGDDDLVADAFLGDLVICAPVVVREAEQQGKPVMAHWAHMVVHGIMHLRGYDHIDEDEAAVMEGMETRVMDRLGFDNPYA